MYPNLEHAKVVLRGKFIAINKKRAQINNLNLYCKEQEKQNPKLVLRRKQQGSEWK